MFQLFFTSLKIKYEDIVNISGYFAMHLLTRKKLTLTSSSSLGFILIIKRSKIITVNLSLRDRALSS